MPAEQGVVSLRTHLRRKSALGAGNAVVGARGASSAEFIRYCERQHNTFVGLNGGRSTLRPTDGEIVSFRLSNAARYRATQNDERCMAVSEAVCLDGGEALSPPTHHQLKYA